MEELLKLMQNFKKPLDKDIQHQMLIQYYETKDEDLRLELLEHNLRLCSKCAIEFCKKYERTDFACEAFSICYSELSNSLDKYNPHNKPFCKFSNYALTNMRLILEKDILRSSLNNNYLTDSVHINEDNEIEDMIPDIEDPSESNIAEDVANKELIQNILKFIENLPTKQRHILKLYLGIDHKRKYSQTEIADALHVSRQYISQSVTENFEKLREFIYKNYKSSYPNLKPNKSPKVFTDKKDRNTYIINSYFGANGESSKKMKEISLDSGLSPFSIYKIINHHRESNPGIELENTRTTFKRTAFYSETRELIFNDYYGLNGCNILSCNEISYKYNLPLNSSYISSLIKYTTLNLIKNNVYTEEDIEKIKENRKIKIRENRLFNEYAPIYFSYYGIEDYEKKSRHQIAKDLRISLTKVDVAIRTYQNYLDNIEFKNSQEQISL